MDDFGEELFADEERDEEERAPGKEQLVFVIDAQPSMLEPCNQEIEDLGTTGKESWLELALRLAARVMRQKVIASERDEVAVVMYNTREKTLNESSFSNVYVYQGLEEPSASRIKKLEAFSSFLFGQNVGSAEKDEAALRSGLWAADSMLYKKDSISRRVLVFTNDDHPVTEQQGRTATEETIKQLAARQTALQLLPMVPDLSDFDLEPFWASALSLTRDPGADEEYDETEQVGSFMDLQETLRSKSYKKRSLSSLKWRWGGGMEIGVKLYALVQPSKKSGYELVHAETGEKLKSHTVTLDPNTAAEVDPKEARTFFPNFKNFRSARFPKVYVTRDEVGQIKKAGMEKGLDLLGFKPLSTLKDHHQLRNSTFVYPDEGSIGGSIVAFVALHRVLLEKDFMAICSFKRQEGSEPRLVALLPQEEVEDEYGILQPNGFNMVYLPFADDIRTPECDSNYTGDTRPDVIEQQIAAAEAMIDALQLTHFQSGGFPNPHLQRHFKVLESAALREEPPDEAEDYTIPDLETGHEAIMRFKDAVYGPGYTEDVAPTKGTKRKPPPVNAEAQAELEALDLPGLKASGRLGKLRVDDLKIYCRLHGLPVSGKKDELLERVSKHLEAGRS